MAGLLPSHHIHLLPAHIDLARSRARGPDFRSLTAFQAGQ
jgi:hypothetical protein